MTNGNKNGQAVSESQRIREVYESRSQLADKYSVFDPGHLALMQSRERRVLEILAGEGIRDLAPLKILDVGCGTGQWLTDLLRWGATAKQTVGVDLNPQRLQAARERLSPDLRLSAADGTKLPFADGQFDLVFLATVLSSVLDRGLRQRIARECLRVLSPGGRLVYFDLAMDNQRNPNVVGIKRSELDDHFGEYDCHWHRTTLAPPLGRLIAPRSQSIYNWLEALPFLRSHTIGIVRKGENS